MKQGQNLERQFLVKDSAAVKCVRKSFKTRCKNQYQNKQKGQPNQIEKKKKKRLDV